MEKLVIGIDAGGSKTEACLARVDHPASQSAQPDAPKPVAVGRGRAGPSNPLTSGESQAFANLEAAIQSAFQDARIECAQVDSLCLGLAGVDRPSVRSTVWNWLRQSQIAHQLRLVNDAELLLAEIEPSTNVIALIAGTGSFAFGRTAAGRTARAGGWGPTLGDEGSGYWVGLESLRQVSREIDGRQPASELTIELKTHLGLEPDGRELPRSVDQLERQGIAALAEVVQAAARKGDAAALSICEAAAAHLVEIVVAVGERLAITDYTLVVSGGLLANESLVSQLLDRRLLLARPRPARVVRAVDLAWGAALLAYTVIQQAAEQESEP